MVYIFLLVFVAFFIFIRKKNPLQDSASISKTDTTVLKGFFALCVILHHLGQRVDLGNILNRCNNNLGGIAVGAFFMLSAFGMCKSYEKEGDNYIITLFQKKIPELYIFQVIINIVYFLLFYLKADLSVSEILIKIFNLNILFNMSGLNGFSWFITTILIVYVLFGIAMMHKRLIKYNKLGFCILMQLLITALYAVVRASGVDTLYVRSIGCFTVGIWYALYQKEIDSLLKRKKPFIIALSVLAVFFVVPQLVYIPFLSHEHIISMNLCCILIVLMQKITFSKNKLFKLIGECSLEIYLLQLIFFNVFGSGIPVEPFYVSFAILASSIAAGYLMHSFYVQIKKIIKFLWSSRLRNGAITKKFRHNRT